MFRGRDRRARLLLAEDDILLARRVACVLRRAGWVVDVVENGREAIDAYRRDQHDVVLLDVMMPDVDGLAVLDAIHREPCPPAVILMSAYLDLDGTLFALERGALEILEKPVDTETLLEVVRRAERERLGRRRPDAHLENVRDAIPEFIGRSAAAHAVREQIVNASRFPELPVMIIGETGTGKELVAQALHRLRGEDGRMVSMNCAALPSELFESEIFGHEAGAFTGAQGARAGLLELAGRGTLFLDEVGEMPLAQQAKLLRVLETRAFRRVGSNKDRTLDARLVSATNRALRGREDDVMRSDLFFRLAGYTIRTPPLRERMEDLDPLAHHLLARFAATDGGPTPGISPRAVEALGAYDWPGNVRELRAVLQHAAVRARGHEVGVRHVAEALRARGCLGDELRSSAPPTSKPVPLSSLSSAPLPKALPSHPDGGKLRDVERDLIARAYAEADGNVSVTARRLGIPRSTLRDKLDRYGLR